MSDTTRDDRLLELEIEKQRLECEKLRAQIESERQPLWKRSGYIASLSPIVIALATFLAAWVTGYFDTQKKSLETEITALEARRDQLQAEAAATQAKVDEVFLNLKLVAGETRYAVGILKALEIERELQQFADEHLTDEQARAALAQFFDQYKIAREIIDDSDAALETLNRTLDRFPISPWAKGLSYRPTPEGTLLFTGDERIFDVARGKFYDNVEAWERNEPSERQKEGTKH